MIKVLAIGNSFSHNATVYFNEISELLKRDIKVTNLYIPGCTLEKHASLIGTSDKPYEYQCGKEVLKMVNLEEALEETDWDIITVQQASDFSGVIEKLEPYLSKILDYIKIKRPQSKIYYHQTWSYDSNSEHPAFMIYDSNQSIMDSRIFDLSIHVSKHYNLPIINVGEKMANLRQLPLFINGNITADGYHLLDPLPRYVAALVWLKTLSYDLSNLDIETLATTLNIPNEVLNLI